LASEDAKRIAMIRKVFGASYSKTVTDYLIYDKTLTEPQKKQVLEIAKQIALSKGHIRVYWEDFAEAINKFRSGLNVGKENNLQKKM
jgi:hypothetical protein